MQAAREPSPWQLRCLSVPSALIDGGECQGLSFPIYKMGTMPVPCTGKQTAPDTSEGSRFIKIRLESRAWCHIPVFPALRMLRQEHGQF